MIPSSSKDEKINVRRKDRLEVIIMQLWDLLTDGPNQGIIHDLQFEIPSEFNPSQGTKMPLSLTPYPSLLR